jgi:hypothetical protein
MKKPSEIVCEVTAAALAASLEGHPSSSTAKSRSPALRRLAPRLLFCASVVAAMAAYQPTTFAAGTGPGTGVPIDSTVGGMLTTPDQAYNLGYAYGKSAVETDGNNDLYGASGNPALDAAFNSGYVDATEGLPANPPGAPGGPPGYPGNQTNNNLDDLTPQEAYALGYDLGLTTPTGEPALIAEGSNASLDDAFGDGFTDGSTGAEAACAGTCGTSCGTNCAGDCGSPGCGSPGCGSPGCGGGCD